MTFYLMRAQYSRSAIEAMVQHPQNREEAVRRSCEALGGKLHHFFYCFGEYDVLGLAELPDNKTAAALSMSLEGSGAVTMANTTILLTVAEAMEAMKAAQTSEYAPPTFNSDRVFRFTINGSEYQWGGAFITGAIVLKLAHADAASHRVLLRRPDGSEQTVGADKLVDLTESGVEEFRIVQGVGDA